MMRILLWVISSTILVNRLTMATDNFEMLEEKKGLLSVSVEDFTEENQAYLEFQNMQEESNHAYNGEDTLFDSRSALTNKIYKNDKITIYNNTQYNLDDVKQKYQLGHLQHVSISDLSISLGYGIEYQFKPQQWIGYEYLSAFPQDYGQSVRLFWRKRF